MTVKVTPADVTDRDAARELLPELRERNPELTLMWADNAYTGLADWARNDLDLTFKVVKKPPNQVGFKVLPRRWIVERSPCAKHRVENSIRFLSTLVRGSNR